MATVLLNDQYLSDTANAIREKAGTAQTYTPAQFADAISGISGGGGGTIHTASADDTVILRGSYDEASVSVAFDWVSEISCAVGDIFVVDNLGIYENINCMGADSHDYYETWSALNFTICVMPDEDVIITYDS